MAPLAIRPGIASEITLSGSDLSEATQLWTSFSIKSESLGEGRFRITADAPSGVGALRVFGSNGVSNFSFIALDDLPTVTETKTNKMRATAQRVDVGAAVDGRCEELSYDWFQFRANKGRRVPVEIIAARLGSKFDSVLRIVNAAGRELARNDDAPGWSGDSYINFTAPEAGDYFIEVRDVNYGGGSAFFYRLRIGGSPLANSNFEKPAAHETRKMVEREPNDSAAKATKISITNAIEGRFNKAGDRDCYEFAARKGERLEFRAATRSLGSVCDAMLQLDSAEGKRLARSNPSAADEGVLTYSFPSNGTYRLIVEEATGAYGSNMFYRITARPAAGFALMLDTDRMNVAPGKSFDLKVNLTRGDYKGR
ncbi:MAG TPA: PPC domain-containing protein [Methylomirabilota bacterium]|nr:PPC domain-containing protein [Methylomirabilota bacterium]